MFVSLCSNVGNKSDAGQTPAEHLVFIYTYYFFNLICCNVSDSLQSMSNSHYLNNLSVYKLVFKNHNPQCIILKTILSSVRKDKWLQYDRPLTTLKITSITLLALPKYGIEWKITVPDFSHIAPKNPVSLGIKNILSQSEVKVVCHLFTMPLSIGEMKDVWK